MRECIWCGKETKNPKFCSISCGAKHQQSQPKILKDKTKTCEECNLVFKYRGDPQQRFCSRSCSATHNNRIRGLRDYKCMNCGEQILGKNAKKFCSVKCSSDFKSERLIADWIEDSNTGTTKQGLKPALKRHLIKEAGYKCSLCGWDKINPVTGRSPLEVDHIDGDCYNNDPSNLQVVCPNCHSLTPTYRALNKSSKRSYRTK